MGFSVLYTPEYLQRTTTGLFLFRLRVPKDCQPDIGKKELKYSLKTRSLREARKITSSILSFLPGVFDNIRIGGNEEHSKATVYLSIKEGIRRARLNELYPHRVTAGEPATTHAPSEPTIGTPEKALQSPQECDKAQPAEAPAPLFSNLRDAFFSEKKLSQGWRPKTQEDHEAVFNLFVEINGDYSGPQNLDSSLSYTLPRGSRTDE
jgi:hypothetical protein